MNWSAKLSSLVAIAFLGACASTPPARLITLDEAGPRSVKASPTPSAAVVRAKLPGLVDRPQLVVRGAGNTIAVSESYRWAEPLRDEISRVIANDLGELLEASGIAALPADRGGSSIDFKLTLDFQQFDAVINQGADVDVLWRVERRDERTIIGRSSFRQPLTGAADDPPALVVAQRRALRRIAEKIAQAIAAYSKT